MAFMNKVEDKLMDVAEFVDSNMYLGSIKNAFTDYVPFIIVGSFGTLLGSLISNTRTGLAQWIPWLANLAPAFSAMSFAAVSCMTIPIIFLIALHLAQAKKMPVFTTAILCVISFITLVPNVVTVAVEEATGSAAGLSGGLPLVLNPVFAIPFILNSGIAATIALVAIKIGFISCSVVDAPFGLPLFINATLSYGWKGAIVQFIILAVGTLIWIPFVLMSNRMAEKEGKG